MCKKKCFSMLSICKDLKNIIQKSVKVITLVSSVFTKKSRNVYHVDEWNARWIIKAPTRCQWRRSGVFPAVLNISAH